VNKPNERGGVGPANLPDYNQNHVFTGIAHVGTPGMNLTGAGTPERIFGIQAGYNFLDVLGIQPVMGRGFTPEEDRYGARHVVVIAHELWQQRLGGQPGIIGRSMRSMENRTKLSVCCRPASRRPRRLASGSPCCS